MEVKKKKLDVWGVYVSRSWGDASLSSANLMVIELGHLLYDPCIGAVTNGSDCF